jgi:hypothetical protein
MPVHALVHFAPLGWPPIVADHGRNQNEAQPPIEMGFRIFGRLQPPIGGIGPWAGPGESLICNPWHWNYQRAKASHPCEALLSLGRIRATMIILSNFFGPPLRKS